MILILYYVYPILSLFLMIFIFILSYFDDLSLSILSLIKGSLVEKLPSYGNLKMQRVQYNNS